MPAKTGRARRFTLHCAPDGARNDRRMTQTSEVVAKRGNSQRTYPKNTLIFREGEHGDEMYFVESGKVLIWKGEGVDRQIIGIIHRGDIFGEMVLFDNKPRMANATATEDTVLRVVSRDQLDKRINDLDPFMRLFVHTIITKLRGLSDLISVLNRELEELRG